MKEELNVSLFSFLSTLKLKKKKKMIVLSRLFVICVVVVLRCAPGYLCCLLKKILLYFCSKSEFELDSVSAYKSHLSRMASCPKTPVKKNYEVKWLFVTVRNKICSFRRFWFLLKRISFAESAFSLNRMQSVLHFYSSQVKRLFNLDTWLVAFTTFQIEIFLHPTNRSKVNIFTSIRERKVIQKNVI